MNPEFRIAIVTDNLTDFENNLEQVPEYQYAIDRQGNNILHLATLHNSHVTPAPLPFVSNEKLTHFYSESER